MNNPKSLILPDRAEVKQMQQQCKFLTVGGKVLTEQQSWSLAILAVSIGLNPFLGEIFYIPGAGPFVGIKGQRRNAKNQLGKDDHVFPPMFIQILPAENGGKEGDIAWECELRDSRSIKEYAKVYQMMREIIGDTNESLLREVVGHSPTTKGIGIVTKTEIAAYNNMDERKRKTAMTPTARCKKRAEADCYRQRFPIGAGVGLLDVNGDAPVIATADGEVIDANIVEIEKPEEETPNENHENPVEDPIPTSIRNYYDMAYKRSEFNAKDKDMLDSILNACEGDPRKAWGVLLEQHTHPEDK